MGLKPCSTFRMGMSPKGSEVGGLAGPEGGLARCGASIIQAMVIDMNGAICEADHSSSPLVVDRRDFF